MRCLPTFCGVSGWGGRDVCKIVLYCSIYDKITVPQICWVKAFSLVFSSMNHWMLFEKLQGKVENWLWTGGQHRFTFLWPSYLWFHTYLCYSVHLAHYKYILYVRLIHIFVNTIFGSWSNIATMNSTRMYYCGVSGKLADCGVIGWWWI